ncbi:MAG: hypothetical protein V1909_04035 [Candidatus Micrarchaeota archaeon]
MGLSTSLATVLILLGLAGAAALAFPIVESGVRGISDSFREQNSLYVERASTSLSVENITVNGSCASYNLTIRLRDSGSSSITIGKLSFFDNGVALNNTLVGALAPRKDINITYENMTSAQQNHRIMVVTGNGIAAYGTYACE